MSRTVSDFSTEAARTLVQEEPPQNATSWIVDPDAITSHLSKRRTRLAAFLSDQVVAVLAFWLTSRLSVSIGFLSYAVLAGYGGVQIILLGTRGQTIAKMILKIAIVDRFDKTPPGFLRAALIRQLPLLVLNFFAPALILVYLIIDGLPIFSASRRCVHDHVAGTIVIDVPSTREFSRS